MFETLRPAADLTAYGTAVTAVPRLVTTDGDLAVVSGFLQSRDLIGLDVLLTDYGPEGEVAFVALAGNDHTQGYIVPRDLVARDARLRRILADGTTLKLLHNSPVKISRLADLGIEVRGYADLMANAGWGSGLRAIAAHHGLRIDEHPSVEDIAAARRRGLDGRTALRAAEHAVVLLPVFCAQRPAVQATGLPDNWYELQRLAARAIGGTDASWELPEGARKHPRLSIRLGGQAKVRDLVLTKASVKAVRRVAEPVSA